MSNLSTIIHQIKLKKMRKIIYEITEENAVAIANILFKKFEEANLSTQDRFLNMDGVSLLTGYKKTSIYGLVKKNKIPYHKKGKLFFLESEIMEWIKNGKKTTNEDIKRRADEYLLKNLL